MKHFAGFALALLSALCLVPPARSATAPSVSPELQKRVRAATYEVVMKRPEKDSLTYEKPLPLELLPFTERNDKYRSIGTAFAIAPNTYVSAGHVMTVGMASAYGAPALRGTDGTVHPIDKVLRFSQHEDFMVFTVAGPPANETTLETGDAPPVDSTIYAVGNALGDGVVIRDGLLTSLTDEEQDGRWKWLRFSAAASPGNSGGPLLDADGRVVGIVIARSPGENLNYALPIQQALKATEIANYDVRQSFALPMLQDTQVASLKASFKLPMAYAEFSERHRKLMLDQYRTERDRLLKDHAKELFPGGDSAKLLASSDRTRLPALIKQDENRVWELQEGASAEVVDLPDDGSVALRRVGQMGLFSVRRGPVAHDDAFYSSSQALMDPLLKALQLTRTVGPQAIRITSAGAARSDTPWTDSLGRHWQLRRWPLEYLQIECIVAALPTPDGYVGMLRFASSAEVPETLDELQMLAPYFHSSFTGSLAQWSAYLARKPLRAAAFDGMKLQMAPAAPFAIESPRLRASVPADLVKLGEASWLRLDMTQIAPNGRLDWDVGGFTLASERDGETFFSLKRQARPASAAGRDSQQRWERMLAHTGDFDGQIGRDPKSFWMRTTVAKDSTPAGLPAATSNVIYESMYRTVDKLLPREADERRLHSFQAVKVLEP